MNYFKEIRKTLKLTQKEMAQRLSISYSHYTKLEISYVQPSFQLLKRTKEVFEKIDMNLFFE